MVANDLLVTTLSAITQGSNIATPVQHLAARLRALARSSATIRDSLGASDFNNNFIYEFGFVRSPRRRPPPEACGVLQKNVLRRDYRMRPELTGLHDNVIRMD